MAGLMVKRAGKLVPADGQAINVVEVEIDPALHARNVAQAKEREQQARHSFGTWKATEGPKLWRRLHQCRTPSAESLADFTRSIPCGECKQHWTQLIARMPPDVSSLAAFRRWTWQIHNAVNARIGKPELSYEDVAALWWPEPFTPPAIAFVPAQAKRSGLAVLALGGPSLAGFDAAAARAAVATIVAVNNAADVVTPDLWIACDQADHFSPAIWRNPDIVKFFPRSRFNDVVDGEKVRYLPNVVAFPLAVEPWQPTQWLRTKSVQWDSEGLHGTRITMAAAIRILIALGFKEIALVGCDWHMDADRPYATAEGKKPEAVKANNRQYAKWADRFATLRPHIEAAGVTIVNATPGSRLKAFDPASIDLSRDGR